MVFGMCANRVIGFVVGFVKDVIASNRVVEVSKNGDESISGEPRFEEVTTTEEKKTI